MTSTPTGSGRETREKVADLRLSPGTLAFALEGERLGLGHVEFQAGRPVWLPGPPRFAEAAK